MYVCILCYIYMPLLCTQLEGSSNLRAGLPDDCQLACVCANSKLDELFQKLETRKVTILELQKIEKQPTQMKYLCEAASTQQNEVSKSVPVSYEAIVKPRIEEFKCFEKQQGVLQRLCLCLQIHKIHGTYI